LTAVGALETSADLVAPCTTDALWAHVDDLSDYPRWMPIVHGVERLADDDGRPAWSVELRTRVGPLARSKRLRMVRTRTTVDDGDRRTARFERVELDGRRHSPWTLDVEVAPAGAGSRVEMHLRYGGSLWTGGILQRVLDDSIRDGRDRLAQLVTHGPTR
jgi:hypothetical protein